MHATDGKAYLRETIEVLLNYVSGKVSLANQYRWRASDLV